MTTAHDLDELWRVLAQPEGPLLEARQLTTWAGGGILAAVDDQHRRHLLVGLPDAINPAQAPLLRGLEIQKRRMRIADRESTWIDLVLLDPDGVAAFTLLCTDITAAAAASADADPTLVATVITRWRRFWSAKPGDIPRDARLGLFGELWFLTHWVPAITAQAVQSWRGPLGGRHDFATEDISVEVKATAATTGPIIHRIAGLSQLAPPARGILYLLSLRVIAEPGDSDNLDGLITSARQAAVHIGYPTADELDERLAAAGWSPVHQGRYTDPLRVTSQVLYRVEGSFPRLTPEALPDLPAGIVDVRYNLDTTVCRPWQITDHPQPELFAQIANGR